MLAFVLGAGAGIAIGIVARAAETSRLAFGPYALYGNGALIVPALGAGLALYGLWTWVLGSARPRPDLLWSALGLHLGLGTGLFATGGTSLEGLFFMGLLFVVPTALVAVAVFSLFAARHRTSSFPGAARRSSALLTLAVLVGMFLAFVLPPLGVGIITGAFIAIGHRAQPAAAIGLGALLVVVLLAAGLAVPLLFLR